MFTIGKERAVDDIREALRIYTAALGKENPSTIDVEHVLSICEPANGAT